MTNVVLKNFVPVTVDCLKEEWTIDYSEGEYFKAICSSSTGKCTASFSINKYGTLFKVISKEDNGELKVLKYRKVQTETYGGNGSIKLSGGPVYSRWACYDSPKFADFKTRFGITNIKKVDNLPLYSFIIEDNERKKTSIIAPSDVVLKTVLGDKGDMLVNVKEMSKFFIFDEYSGGKRKRTLFVKSGINALSLNSELENLNLAV